jgi:hypothetical protein
MSLVHYSTVAFNFAWLFILLIVEIYCMSTRMCLMVSSQHITNTQMWHVLSILSTGFPIFQYYQECGNKESYTLFVYIRVHDLEEGPDSEIRQQVWID